ncbi:hypothetical protein HDA40_006567 [Hamadaea flava]|uniref:Endo alpha-1,4 polygalactosaminidase n=1 Tax=Hamadaea flava TaxID=1742688 RepID=A0ABV8LUI0_9ACTN|nr:endo alpha-1,4 polygalactosaminidase [Hamadaea flava]MCP2328060.1 hypothetical protein [Hamadaea flava]
MLALTLATAGCGSASGPSVAAHSASTSPSGTPTAEPASATASSSPAAATATAAPTESASTARWKPRVGQTWQWQLSGRLDLTVPAEVYDVDLFTTTAAQVAALHKAGRKVICYLNAGAQEDFRTDSGRYPKSVLGKELDGWPGEHWVDIRRWDLLSPILTDRMKMCRDKGFDGVEPDNLEAYANDSGFSLTAADQLAFNRRVADLAHRHGLAVGLKNDVDQAKQLQPSFDFAVNEECAQYAECARLSVFVTAGKPVFHVEYDLSPAQFCPATRKLRFASMRKHLDLDAWRSVCP